MEILCNMELHHGTVVARARGCVTLCAIAFSPAAAPHEKSAAKQKPIQEYKQMFCEELEDF